MQLYENYIRLLVTEKYRYGDQAPTVSLAVRFLGEFEV